MSVEIEYNFLPMQCVQTTAQTYSMYLLRFFCADLIKLLQDIIIVVVNALLSVQCVSSFIIEYNMYLLFIVLFFLLY